ncbi:MULTISPECIES: hypothetical protein, partial [unclassified Streptomyces]|uniref:hypothetical protein n=1 Tax=unclassified Streptomyces TaxID=2593676 RepID=UPI001EEF8CEB
QAGVSTYLALTFGTLLSSQGTDASFGPVSPGPSGRFPSCFFVLLSCVSDSIRLFRVRFPVEAGRAVSLSRFFAFAFSLSGGSNFTRLFFVPFPVRIRFPMACGVALPFGGSDFIRSASTE